MTIPNTLIFVDLAADDPAAAGEFYAEVFGWENDPRPYGVYHRMVPGGNMIDGKGAESAIGNFHIGIHKAENARPHPKQEGVEPRELSKVGRKPRVWILVSEDDSIEAILERALDRGANLLWKDHFWREFNGFNAAFSDPWGNEILLWVKGGDAPVVPANFTEE
ncbi:VOC family protein [Paraglaciecola sp. L3A3]|uniref:VOC family protein n=1 Tax=Paraglaciecola sp. L3A3 TaxID=2686358 RepID=UPI0018EECB08|nr:VOC family protein [Paraglaciecola sp. L3A3]